MFHFFGVESDSLRVREAINKMVEKGRIGNFSLVTSHYSLHQEPGLTLQVSLLSGRDFSKNRQTKLLAADSLHGIVFADSLCL